jgi:hypothetical protein
VGRTAFGAAGSAEIGTTPAAEYAQTPCGWPGPSAVKASVVPSKHQDSSPATAPGSGIVRRSGTSRSISSISDSPPRTFHSTATDRPSAVRLNDSTSAVSDPARMSAVPSATRISTGNSPLSERA